MAYVADVFVAGEQPTTSKWNELWGNDASFNDGTGIGNSSILSRHLGAGLVGTGANSGFMSAAIGSFSVPGATGNFSISGLGFAPKIVKFFMLYSTTLTDATNAYGGMTSSNQFAIANHSSSGNINSYSSTSNCLAYTPFNSDVPAVLANYVSMNTGGFTINFSVVTGGGSFAYEAWG